MYYCRECGKKKKVDSNNKCYYCGADMVKEVVKNVTYPKPPKKKLTVSRFLRNLLIIVIVIFFIFSNIWRTVNNGVIDENNKIIAEHRKTNNADIAIEKLKKLLNKATTKETKELILQNIGNIYSEEGDNYKAIEYYSKSIEYNKKDTYEYYINKANIYESKNNLEEAEKTYLKALAEKPNDYLINNHLSLFYFKENTIKTDFKKALEYARKSLKYSDLVDIKVAKENLAIILYYNEEYDEAIKYFLEVDSIGKFYIKEWLGYSYQILEKYDKAKYYFEKAIEEGAEDIDLLRNEIEYIEENYGNKK